MSVGKAVNSIFQDAPFHQLVCPCNIWALIHCFVVPFR